MMDKRRALLALRAIDVSYRASLGGAPTSGAEQREWLDAAYRRARHLLNALESSVLQNGRMDPEVELQFRVVRDGIRRADAGARSVDLEAHERRDETG